MKYRREIDGLRAFAVIPVILFHAGFSAFSGGFVGVDVFFVISGYLITTIIISEKVAGNFSIINFYERRSRRILPVLFLVMAACIPFAWILLPPSNMVNFSESLVAVSLFVSNILFWRVSTGYFDATAELNPLLHTWSLAVEEQFYVIFPLLIILAWRFGQKILLIVLAIIATTSLVLAQWGSTHAPSATFYLLHTRAWELGVGSFVAFYMANRPSPVTKSFSAEILSALGLFLIIYGIFAFNEATPFPSFFALIPTLGVALIIIFATSQTHVGTLLGNRLLVGLGLVSYSAYLWHQPLFAFARLGSLEKPSSIVFLGLSVASILMAYFSWRFVEQPFRRKDLIGRKAIFSFALIGSLAFIPFGVMGYLSKGYVDRIPMYKEYAKNFAWNTLRQDCDKDSGNEPSAKFCTLGNLSEKRSTIAVFGDSHSGALLSAFDATGKLTNKSFVHNGLNSCPPLLGVNVFIKSNGVKDCQSMAQLQYDYVKNNSISKVFLVGRWSAYTDGSKYDEVMDNYFLVSNNEQEHSKERSRINFKAALLKTITEYQKLGVDVYLVEQVPQQKIGIERTYFDLHRRELIGSDRASDILKNASVRLDEHINLQKYNRKVIEEVATSRDFKVINLDSTYCDGTRCLIGSRDHSYYTDIDHLNAYGAGLAIDGLRPFF